MYTNAPVPTWWWWTIHPAVSGVSPDRGVFRSDGTTTTSPRDEPLAPTVEQEGGEHGGEQQGGGRPHALRRARSRHRGHGDAAGGGRVGGVVPDAAVGAGVATLVGVFGGVAGHQLEDRNTGESVARIWSSGFRDVLFTPSYRFHHLLL